MQDPDCTYAVSAGKPSASSSPRRLRTWTTSGSTGDIHRRQTGASLSVRRHPADHAGAAVAGAQLTRSATIVGAITGGGIGLLLTQAIINQKDWEEVTQYIVLMVMLMDWISGSLRNRLIQGGGYDH